MSEYYKNISLYENIHDSGGKNIDEKPMGLCHEIDQEKSDYCSNQISENSYYKEENCDCSNDININCSPISKCHTEGPATAISNRPTSLKQNFSTMTDTKNLGDELKEKRKYKELEDLDTFNCASFKRQKKEEYEEINFQSKYYIYIYYF